jgi:ATP-dependent Clp protease ATP-binding subunit ClpA
VVARKASAGAELFGLGSFVIWLPAGQLWAHDRYAMFERFTDRARRAVVLAQEEARKLGHDYIGTEHLLLGLIREGEGVAAQVLVKLAADLSRVRRQVLQQLSAYADGQEGITAAEREELLAERLEPPDEELMAPAPYAAGDKIEEIHAVLREIVARLERIERHLTEGDDTP